MNMTPAALQWLTPGQAFPDIQQAWDATSIAPGLLCAGGDLSIDSLKRAYKNGIYPWFSHDQPILWWSPDPRMVLKTAEFKLHPAFRKTLKKFTRAPNCEIRIDCAFESVIRACATAPRHNQTGTWIVPEMIDAYLAFNRAGLVHSIETWVDGQLVGGLYFVAIGHAVFGESMFHQATDGSKIALAALVAMCRRFHISQIDCQQNTRHLASLGAIEISRECFANTMRELVEMPSLDWKFSPVYWREIGIFDTSTTDTTPETHIGKPPVLRDGGLPVQLS